MEGGEETKEEANKSQLDSGETSCPGCGAPSHAFSQRLLEDNCGHKKCRKCFLVEESGCSQCEIENVPIVSIPDQTILPVLLQNVSNKEQNLPEHSDISRPETRAPGTIKPQDSESILPLSSPNISVPQKPSPPTPVSNTTEAIPNLSLETNNAKLSTEVNHEKVKEMSIQLSSSVQHFINNHTNTISNCQVSQTNSILPPSIESKQINELLYPSQKLISLPLSTSLVKARSPKTVSLLLDSICLSTGVPPPENAKVLAIQDNSAITLPSMSNLQDLLHHELSDNLRQGKDESKTDYELQRSEQSDKERATPDELDKVKEIDQKQLEKVQTHNSHYNSKSILENSRIGGPLKSSDQEEAPISISEQPRIQTEVATERFQRISVIVPNKKLKQNTVAEAPQIQTVKPDVNKKPQLTMLDIEERIRKELRDKDEDQDLMTTQYDNDKSPSNYSNDNVEDTANIKSPFEEESNEGCIDNGKDNDNAIVDNEDNGTIMLQKSMEQDLLRELREHFQDIGEESPLDSSRYEPSFPPKWHHKHFNKSGSYIKELPSSQGSPSINHPMLPKKLVPKFVVNDAQASGHDNGELISSKYQDETEASSRPSKLQEILTEHKPEERYLALEELDVGSNRSYRYDRVISASKLTMLDKWLTHLRQDAPEEDNYIEHDSLQGEAEIGSNEDMNLLAVDERHVDDFIEEDFNEERVDDCEAPPPPDITSQDPEEVIQRGMVVSQNFLQEIQNAMDFESNSDGDTSQQEETGEGQDRSKGRRGDQKLLPEHILVRDEDHALLFCNKCQQTFLFDQCIKHINCKGKKTPRIPKKMHECSYCNKQCRSSSHLKYHIRSAHTGERPYKCTLCSMSFLQIVKLKRHILTHTGEKPYECDICGASFRTGYHLKEHRNIHTRDTQYSCEVCNRTFADSSNLRRHIKNLHGKKTVACQNCTKLFPTKHDLFVHKKEHLTVAKQHYNCQLCDKKFTTQTGLNRHSSSSHSKNLDIPTNLVRQTKDQVPDIVFSPAPYSTNTTSKIQSNRNTHPTQYQTAPINSIENEVHKNNGILKRNSEIDDLKCTPTKKIQIKDSQQPTKDTSTASLLKALKTSPSLRKELSESLTETSLLQVCGGDEEMARKLLAELSSQNKTSSVSFSSTSSSLSKTTPIDSRSPTRKSTIVAASHLPIMSNMELAYLKEINDRCPINYEEEIRNYELSTAYAQQIRDSTSKETRENYGHHTTLPPVIVQERPSLRYDNEPVAGSSKHFIGQSMGAGSSSNIHRFKYKRRPGHIVVPSVHSLPTLTPCESPNEQQIPGISKEDAIQSTHQYDPIKNLNMQEKVILKKLFEENRLEVPAEFQDVEDGSRRPEPVKLEDQEAATKKRFLSRYRNQSGLPSKEQKESCDPETLHSLIETSKLLLSSNSIQISLTKEQEQNFIFSMLKIIKETE